jgi:hypothetical protein
MAGLGYSGTPLSKKLGLKEGLAVSWVDAPDELRGWLAPLPAGLTIDTRPGRGSDLVHAFFTERARLASQLVAWRRALRTDVVLWISWPKKNQKTAAAGAGARASADAKVPTNITEDVIREVALPLGWVDVKVCAVSEVWSGLKLVVRKELR